MITVIRTGMPNAAGSPKYCMVDVAMVDNITVVIMIYPIFASNDRLKINRIVIKNNG